MKYFLPFLLFILAAFTAPFAYADESNDITRNQLRAASMVGKGELVIENFIKNPDFGENFQKYLKSARAVVIIPKLFKGGFLIGGEKGTGIVLARNPNTGMWSYPIFYDFYSASIGLQIGFETSRHVLLVMTDRGLDSLLFDRFKLGGELQAAAGLRGKSLEASTTRNLNIDILSYSANSGAYVGANLEGSYLEINHELQNAYYGGRDISATDIIVKEIYTNIHADSLCDYIKEVSE